VPDDAMDWDNNVTLEPDRPSTVHVGTALPGGTPAGDAVARFVRAAPDVSTEEPSDLTFRVGSTKPWEVDLSARGDSRAFLGPFLADRTHPLLDDVSFEGVVWAAGENPPGRSLLTAGTRVLLSEESGPRYHLNLDVARSNVHRTAAWPILLGNLLELRRRAISGLPRRNIVAGTDVRLWLDEGGWLLKTPAEDVPLLPGAQTLRLIQGPHELLREGAVVERVHVNALDEVESNLTTRSTGTRAAKVGTSSGAAELPPDRSPWPLAILLLALLADFALAAPGLQRWSPRLVQR